MRKPLWLAVLGRAAFRRSACVGIAWPDEDAVLVGACRPSGLQRTSREGGLLPAQSVHWPPPPPLNSGCRTSLLTHCWQVLVLPSHFIGAALSKSGSVCLCDAWVTQSAALKIKCSSRKESPLGNGEPRCHILPGFMAHFISLSLLSLPRCFWFSLHAVFHYKKSTRWFVNGVRVQMAGVLR